MENFPTGYPNPDQGVDISQEENFVENKFGSNYSQIVTLGINVTKRSYSLKWDAIEATKGKELLEWFLARKNRYPFMYAYFNKEPRPFICREASLKDYDPNYVQLTVTIEEFFNIV